MASFIFSPDLNASQLLLGISKRKSDDERLITKAFLVGRQAGALERARLQFLQEQNQALQQQMQTMGLLLSLLQQQKGEGALPSLPPARPSAMPGGTPASAASGLSGILPNAPVPPEPNIGFSGNTSMPIQSPF